MTPEVEQLRLKYDHLMRRRKEIRSSVKEEYKDVIQKEIGRRIEDEDRKFAEELVKAKEEGMTRSEIAEAMRSNDHNRIKYFLNLAGDPGFTRGRPKKSALDTLKEKIGFEVLDAGKGLVRVYRLHKYTFEVPVEAYLHWYAGMNYHLVSDEFDLSEYQTMRDLYRRDKEENRKVVFDLMKIREELEREGWTENYEPGAEDAGATETEEYVDMEKYF